MNRSTPPQLVALAAVLFAVGLPAQRWRSADKIVVANRGSGDITVIDARRAAVEKTVKLPEKNNTPAEPMYVAQAGDVVFVGDRAHDRIACFNAGTFQYFGEIPAGKGVFHMWTDGRQLWVNNDIDKTTTVIDARRNKVLTTIAMPADLTADGFKPHDVFVAWGRAWISMLKSGTPGVVLQYSTHSFRLLRRATVGIDPHLWLDAWTGVLIVPAQGSNRIDFLNGRSLQRLHSLSLPGVHGVYSPRFSRALYVTNLPGAGQKDLYNIALGFHPYARPRLRSTTDTGIPVAHNIAATRFGSRVFVTHSGATSRKVTAYAPAGFPWRPRGLRKIATLDVGLNPFGLAYVRVPR